MAVCMCLVSYHFPRLRFHFFEMMLRSMKTLLKECETDRGDERWWIPLCLEERSLWMNRQHWSRPDTSLQVRKYKLVESISQLIWIDSEPHILPDMNLHTHTLNRKSPTHKLSKCDWNVCDFFLVCKHVFTHITHTLCMCWTSKDIFSSQ